MFFQDISAKLSKQKKTLVYISLILIAIAFFVSSILPFILIILLISLASILSKQKSTLVNTSLILLAITFFSSPFLPFILVIFLLSLVFILGVAALVIILKSKRTIPGLKRAIFGTVLSLSLLAYVIICYYVYALTAAIETGNIQKIKKLISKGYDVNAASGGGQNMLTLAFRYGHRKISPFRDTLQISLMTPEQVEDKILEILKILIENGADINVLDEQDSAPLHRAAARNQTRIVRMLINKGADVNLKGRSGNYPLNYAADHPSTSEIIEILIANGADVNVKGARGNTPLHDSIYSGSSDVFETLIKSGAHVNAKNDKGKTPLQLALEDDYKEKAELLRKYGAKE